LKSKKIEKTKRKKTKKRKRVNCGRSLLRARTTSGETEKRRKKRKRKEREKKKKKGKERKGDLACICCRRLAKSTRLRNITPGRRLSPLFVQSKYFSGLGLKFGILGKSSGE